MFKKICVNLCYLWEIIRVIRVIRVQEKSVYICVICGRVLFELYVVQEKSVYICVICGKLFVSFELFVFKKNLCISVLSVGECYSSYPLFKKICVNLCYLWESVIRVIRCSRKICVNLCYLWENSIIPVINVICGRTVSGKETRLPSRWKTGGANASL